MGIQDTDEIERILRYNGGVQVTIGAVTTWGNLQEIDEAVFQGEAQVIARARTVLVPTGKFSDIDEGQLITVGGTTYEIRERRTEADGKITRIWLRDV